MVSESESNSFVKPTLKVYDGHQKACRDFGQHTWRFDWFASKKSQFQTPDGSNFFNQHVLMESVNYVDK